MINVISRELQPRDKAAMLVVNTKEIFLLNLQQNRVHFPTERNAFVLDHQHGRLDVTCKPVIGFICWMFPVVFSKVLAALKTNLITARALRKGHSARMLPNVRKDHSIRTPT